jgi:hypothetical protein
VNPILEGIYHWLYLRLTGSRCYACGRLMLLHTPRQTNSCYDIPLAIELTDRGWLRIHGIDPESVDAA